MTSLRAALLLISLATVPGSLFAQQAKRDSVTTLPDVVRAVTRDSAAIWNFPGAISRRPIDPALAASGRLEDGFALAPGVLAQSRSGGMDLRITIRGYGARGAGDRSNAGTMRGVRVLVDGFPETEPDGRTSLDLVDLGLGTQLDVLRSNASAVWGNAAGGVVALSTTPVAGTGAGAIVSGGSFGLRRAIANGATEWSDGTLYGTVEHTALDGWRANSAGERTIVNLGFVTPTDRNTSLAVHVLGALNKFSIPGALTADQLAADPQQANATYLARRERRDNQMVRIGTSLTHHLNPSLALAVSGFVTPKHLERSERGTYRFFDRIHRGGSVLAEQTLTNAGTLTAGADLAYQDGPATFWSLTSDGEQGDVKQQDKNEGAQNAGIFLQHEITLGSKLTLTTGARYDAIEYSLIDNITPQLNAEMRFSQVTPKLGATFHAGRTQIFYATLGGGIEAPAANELDPPGTFGQDTLVGMNPLLEPIRSLTFEVGTRHLVAPRSGIFRTVSYDVAAYSTGVRNEVVPYRGGRFYFTAGEARRKGIEGSVLAELDGGVGVSASVTLQDHRYTEYVVDSAYYNKPGHYADFSGNRVVGTPQTMYGVDVSWLPQMVEPLRIGFGVQSVGSYFADDANLVEVPRSVVATASLSLSRPLPLGGALGLRGSLQFVNIFDRANVGSAFLNPDLVNGQPAAYEPGMPQQVIVGFSLGWVEAH
jgi:iron complex outermembrane receptor protein